MLVSQLKLAPGERLLWQGAPPRGLRVGWADVPITAFMVVWAGIPLQAAITTARAGSGPDVFLLPFLFVGLYMLVGRFAVDAWLRSRTTYMLTSRRAVIQRGAPFASERSIALARIDDLQFKPGRNGRGTILFGTGISIWNRGGWSLAGMPGGQPSFAGIADAERVYDLAVRAQNGAE